MPAETPEVTRQDQERINSFGRLNNQLADVQAELDGKKKLLQNLEEAGNELLVSDEPAAPYVLGECFVLLPNEAAEARLAEESSAAEAEVGRLNMQLGSIKGEMDALKKVLYSKFGNAINLESD